MFVDGTTGNGQVERKMWERASGGGRGAAGFGKRRNISREGAKCGCLTIRYPPITTHYFMLLARL
jgi:hypothetical protein